MFNLEATPAESTSYRLARHDKEQFPDIISSGDADPFYTTDDGYQSIIPQMCFWEALDQESLQSKYTGGTVIHIFMGED